jgi:hypothetical protein
MLIMDRIMFFDYDKGVKQYKSPEDVYKEYETLRKFSASQIARMNIYFTMQAEELKCFQTYQLACALKALFLFGDAK